jgi:hypothetical protein
VQRPHRVRRPRRCPSLTNGIQAIFDSLCDTKDANVALQFPGSLSSRSARRYLGWSTDALLDPDTRNPNGLLNFGSIKVSVGAEHALGKRGTDDSYLASQPAVVIDLIGWSFMQPPCFRSTSSSLSRYRPSTGVDCLQSMLRLYGTLSH